MSETAHQRRTTALASANGLLFAMVAMMAITLLLLIGGWSACFLDVPNDLLAAHLLCSLPLAVAVTIRMQTMPSAVAIAAGAGVGLLAVLLARLKVPGPNGVVLTDVAVRSLATLAVASLAVSLLMRLRGHRERIASFPPAALLLCLAVMVLPATLYTVTVTQRLEEKLEDLLDHSRVAKAAEVADTLERIAPEAVWQERPIRHLATELAQQTEQLTDALEKAGPPRSLGEVGQYVNVCLQLDRWGRARKLLHPLTTASQPLPLALDTLGLICQREEKWEESLRWYSKAHRAWSAQPDGSNAAGLASALKGVALAQYQTGRFREAAASYDSLVQLQPTAANYLLAARFYKENDQLARARQHAEAALELDPAATGPAAEELIRSLEQSRFGCFAGM